jgi:hypothetical protein
MAGTNFALLPVGREQPNHKRCHEVAMNCQSCNTTIDYRFQSSCSHCETEQVELLPVNPIHDPVESENRLTWTARIVNLAYLVVSSFAGMISGAMLIYFGTAMFCIAFLSSSGNASHDCARGNAIGFLAIFSGAFLGTVGGSVFAVKKPICKPAVTSGR